MASILYLGVASILVIFFPLRNMRINNTSLYIMLNILNLIATFYIALFFFILHRITAGKYRNTSALSVVVAAILGFSMLRSLWLLAQEFLVFRGKMGTGSPDFRILTMGLFALVLFLFFHFMNKETPLKKGGRLEGAVILARIIMGIIFPFFLIVFLTLKQILPLSGFGFIFNRWIVVFIQLINFAALWYFFYSIYHEGDDCPFQEQTIH